MSSMRELTGQQRTPQAGGISYPGQTRLNMRTLSLKELVHIKGTAVATCIVIMNTTCTCILMFAVSTLSVAVPLSAEVKGFRFRVYLSADTSWLQPNGPRLRGWGRNYI